MQNTDEIWRHVEAKQDDYIALSDRVWGMPELNFQEHRSAAEHKAMLEKEGFRITENVSDIPTAFVGEAGEGGPVVAILGEFDALPGLSQEAGAAEHRPLPGDGTGHGCGHNLLGSGALLAATAVKDWMAQNGIKGRVRYYGCPAEEGGAAKTFMVRDGVFDDVDVAISWHPSHMVGVNPARSLAITLLDFSFAGRSAHAAGSPELGRSALDAVELMNVGVNYVREHMPSGARIHYATTDAGGIAPNVVQAHARVRYLVRARELSQLTPLVERVKKCAEGAALMTETTVTHKVLSAMSNLLGNTPMEEAMHRNLERLGVPEADAADRAYAEQIRATLSPEEIAAAESRLGRPGSGEVLASAITPINGAPEGPMGSTDIGDVSWAVPTVYLRGATVAVGTVFHTWQVTAQGKSPFAHKGMVHAAKTMAATARDVLSDPALLAAATSAHKARLQRTPFVSPLPPGMAPVLDIAAA